MDLFIVRVLQNWNAADEMYERRVINILSQLSGRKRNCNIGHVYYFSYLAACIKRKRGNENQQELPKRNCK